MSRQNKVNPGMYTQRGRLTQDDAARELRKQRSIGSEHTWQPVKKNAMPELGPGGDDSNRDAETSEDNEDVETTPVEAEARPVSRATKRQTAKKAVPVKAKAKASKPKAAKSTVTASRATKAKTVKAKTVKAKTGKAAKTVGKVSGTSVKRKAVLARNVGGGGAKPRPTTKRRKS